MSTHTPEEYPAPGNNSTGVREQHAKHWQGNIHATEDVLHVHPTEMRFLRGPLRKPSFHLNKRALLSFFSSLFYSCTQRCCVRLGRGNNGCNSSIIQQHWLAVCQKHRSETLSYRRSPENAGTVGSLLRKHWWVSLSGSLRLELIFIKDWENAVVRLFGHIDWENTEIGSPYFKILHLLQRTFDVFRVYSRVFVNKSIQWRCRASLTSWCNDNKSFNTFDI